MMAGTAVPPLTVIVAAIAAPVAMIVDTFAQVAPGGDGLDTWTERGLLAVAVGGLGVVVRYFAAGKIVAVDTNSRESKLVELVEETHKLTSSVVDVSTKQQELIDRLIAAQSH